MNKTCGYKLNYLQDREIGEVLHEDAVGEPELGASYQTANWRPLGQITIVEEELWV